MALVLAPEAPLEDWFTDLDVLAERSPGFFAGRPVILDVAAVTLEKAELTKLIADLSERNVRVMAIEGAEPQMLGLGLPPPLTSNRPDSEVEVPDLSPDEPPPPPPKPSTLFVETTVRSGQTVMHSHGDVTVLGAIGSGAEVISGGSIYTFGALRGRAIAGTTGDIDARIVCRKLEAELVSIDGFYKTADDMDSALRGRPVQIWLEGDAIKMAALD
ncbi:septum site-determining protein MinC [Faunimonas pinastri]|uniref:Probable septum site-determining protein MinC n=1 Tax=Faunimonas pinastri TaxID=1855383 RepID=A0A1H9KY95_9HYPH|nr:septum site-determining protein MinC [Faunimonas pinastri]SER04174.1 septum site-determining protein MinC [Faunimonas pinastri]